MKKIFTLVAAALVAAGAWGAEEEFVMDLNATTVPETVEFSNDVWAETYNEEYQYIEASPFLVSHLFGTSSWGGSYWDGFTISQKTDTQDYGAEGSSAGWIGNEFSSVTGGGVEAGEPYLVGYWGWYTGDDEARSCHITFNDGDFYDIQGVYVTNATWPYYSCKNNGDGFARPFNQEGDSFMLIAHGVKADGSETTAEIELIGFHNGQFTAIEDWQWWDLTSLGACEKVYFTMTSTDSGDWGINTAKYFCLSRFTVKKNSTAIESVSTGKQVASVKYVNLNGVESATPFQGVNIEVKTYTDGTHSSTKVIR